MTAIDAAVVGDGVAAVWDDEIVPALHDYIAIPALSPAFDADWAEHGHLDRAVELVRSWIASRPVEGMTVEVVRLPGRTPTIVVEIPPTDPDDPSLAADTVLLYGHVDKQPEMVGWRDGLGPWVPVLDGDRLYGRGGADDGYAGFAALAAVEVLRAAGGRHARLVVLLEGSEESGSPDLPAYFAHLRDRIGAVSLVIALDSGCASYDRLWVTSSLRGNLVGTLRVRVLTEGVHSGAASGIVPSSFRIARALLERVEDALTGAIRLPELHVAIPDDVRRAIAESMGRLSWRKGFPMAGDTELVHDDPVELALNQTWRPTLSVTGADGLPPTARAGNVLRPETALKLSFRLPPTCDPVAAEAAVRRALTSNVPSRAEVTWEHPEVSPGWAAPPVAPWLAEALTDASEAVFAKPARFVGEGGTIPFMGMLGEAFPDAQFVITGVLGPASNAHGPNEFLHLPMARGVTAAVAHLLHAHATRPARA